MLASAVIVPADVPTATTASPPRSRTRSRSPSANSTDPQPPPHKRAASASASPAAKRARRSASPAQGRAGSKPSRDADRARSRRLFGAVLGGLARPQAGRGAASTAAAARRRADADAEARSKRLLDVESEAEAVAEEEHSARERGEEARRALKEWREEESKAWELESIRLGRANRRAASRFLRTTAVPVLYYLPSKLTAKEQQQLDAQVEREAEQRDGGDGEAALSRVATERQADVDISARVEVVPRVNGTDAAVEGDVGKAPVGSEAPQQELMEERVKQNEAKATTTVTDAVDTDTGKTASDADAVRETGDDGDEVVVEAGEDSVIY